MYNLLLFVIVFHLTVISNVQSDLERKISYIKIFYYEALFKPEIDIARRDVPGNFNKDLPIKLLIHGWNADRNQVAMEPIKTAYLNKGGMNLLVADWGSLAHGLYFQDTTLVSIIGKRLAEILNKFMIKMDIPLDKVHVIGHSLGAHISTHLGRYFDGNIPRITGLDPAGPGFLSTSPDALNKKDAKFVDVIHSDSMVLGSFTPRGHIDFYPNGETFSQPGCEIEDVILLHSCSHFRSTNFFAESIEFPKAFKGFKCTLSEVVSNQGKYCMKRGEKGIYMGEKLTQFEASSYSNVFYLQTDRVTPYGFG